jgi:AraC family transcriptional regulator
MDVYAFARWFKSTFGVPPHRYVLQRRIERAQALLRATALPLTHIALECGFYSASHFSTVFKKNIGVTPTEYRISITS